MLRAARALVVAEVDRLGALVSQHPGFSICLLGHSLGGGVAALAACMLRGVPELSAKLGGASVTAFAFAAPPVVTEDVAAKAAPFVTTVINNVGGTVEPGQVACKGQGAALCRGGGATLCFGRCTAWDVSWESTLLLPAHAHTHVHANQPRPQLHMAAVHCMNATKLATLLIGGHQTAMPARLTAHTVSGMKHDACSMSLTTPSQNDMIARTSVASIADLSREVVAASEEAGKSSQVTSAARCALLGWLL